MPTLKSIGEVTRGTGDTSVVRLGKNDRALWVVDTYGRVIAQLWINIDERMDLTVFDNRTNIKFGPPMAEIRIPTGLKRIKAK